MGAYLHGLRFTTLWKDTIEEMDRQRRKQAGFLVHGLCPWDAIESIGVRSQATKTAVERALGADASASRPAAIRSDWCY